MAHSSIGPSTDPKTRNSRKDIPPMGVVASFRYNNPGAQYPSSEAARFGQTGYGIIGGGHKIARFPSPVNGAASNFELLHRAYTGLSIGAAGKKWTGSHGFGIPGYNSADTLTKTMVDDPKTAIPLMKAIAHRESGKGNNLSEHQWQLAHRMFRLGSADKLLAELGKQPDPTAGNEVAETDGAALVKLARRHVGQEYRNVLVPKDDANWDGPWDCAEFVSWLVYQHGGLLYGCIDNDGPPKTTEAYTGSWKRDALSLGIKVSVEEAASTVGGILLRYPPKPGRMGHIALCDGAGGTIEAKSKVAGVVEDTVHGRNWHTGILIPGFTYARFDGVEISKPAFIYRIGATNMSNLVVQRIQTALKERGYDPGLIDGDFGPNTEAAVLAFQAALGLVVDGEVGPETAGALGISLDPAETVITPSPKDPVVIQPSPDPTQGELASGGSPLLFILLSLLLKGRTMTKGPLTGADRPQNILLLALIQALASGKSLDSETLIRAFLPGASKPDGGSEELDPQTLLLKLLQQHFAATDDADAKPDLGPVNGALGDPLGRLLNGYKSTLGIVGSVLTGILGSSSGEGILNSVATSIPALAGTSNVFLPLFLGLAAWGFLGKLEKWNRPN